MKKKFSLLLAMACSIVAAQSQTLITYGTNTVSKDEFLRAYNKNKTPVTDKEKSIRDYIDLYTNFKLKVKAAKDLRIDTLPQLQTDMDNFRRQVDENYMSDEKALNVLIDQAFNRSLHDLHTLLFSVTIPADAQPEDTMKLYQAMQSLYNDLKSGKTNYSELAEKSFAKYGDLGYITVFSLPYQYENIVYSLKPGETSTPYRAKKSWHIFKLVDQRNDAGKWKVAQILLAYPPDADDATKQKTKKLADSLYTLIQGGADFATLAKSYSNDKLTYMNGGEIPEFGSGKFDYSFEKEVFALTKDGDITKPFSTAYGFHIVKRIGYTATVTDKSDASLQFELKQKTMQDARISEAKEKFAKDIITKIGYKRLPGVKDEDLLRFADSLVMHEDPEYVNQVAISNKPIIVFTKSSLKGSDWLKFVKEYKGNFENYKGESNKELWDKYITISSLEYYKKHLEEYNEDFKFQMMEFKEGNMLFEIMEKNVWNKAGIDSVGLLKYFNEHKENYRWGASADVLIVNSTSEKAAQEAMAALKTGKPFKEIVEEKNNEVQVDSARYELAQINGATNSFPAGADAYSTIVKNSDGTATFIKYLKTYEANQQRSFDEARGLVINDYQNVLEIKWLAELKKKYPVKVNEALVKTLIK
ncbi:MAG: peptidylprolyl isomerase [Ferruginibacter sp.]